ncbi:MAG TPA: glycosyltransferase family 4 protein, partial [Longimicrobiaceae bacterium]|nr:glycosyltransferase family 4 protein [Longimicrobiaceae bacterium]
TFARSGVVREKIRVVPGCLDPARYVLPTTPVTRGPEFRFLSLFDFTPRKGWDLLLRAYCEEFTASDPVMLVVKVVNIFRDPLGPCKRVDEFLRHHGFRNPPPLEIIDGRFSEEQLVDLYRQSDAFVLPSRGEGWGRPYMEAMAFGLPTIGTDWSGNLGFMHEDNSYLVEIEGLEPCERTWPEMPLYRGHQWAVPSIASVRRRMREVFENREEAAARGQRARQELLSNFGLTAAGETLSAEFHRLVGE